LRNGLRVTKKKYRKQTLRRVCTPLLGLSLALPIVAEAPFAAAQQVRGPASRPVVTPELKGRTVEDVRILGNTTVAYNIIRRLIRTQVGDKYDPAAVQDDYQRVFELKKFANVEARVEPTRTGGVIVVFVVTEQKLIKLLKFHGNRNITTDILKTVIDIKEGQAIDSFRISLARQAIVNKYREENYPMAHVEVLTDPLVQRGELIFDIVEGPHVRIRKVDFIGVHSFTKGFFGKLPGQVKSAPYFFIFSPGKFDPDVVDEDVGSIRRYYEGKGFFDVRVDRKLIYSPDNSELEIDFVIDEGPRYIINRVVFEGNSKLGDPALRKDLKLGPGQYWDLETVERDRKQLVTAYSPFGFIYQPNSSDEDYLRIEPKPVFLKVPGRVDLVYAIHEGKPFRVATINVRGNFKSKDSLVLREFRKMYPGSLYNSGDVQDATERLKGLPYFSNITVNPVGDDPNYRDLLVELNEGRTASFNIGAGINSNGGVGGTLTYRQQNFDIANPPDDIRDIFSDRAFTGAGQQFVASFEPGTIATNASLRFTEPYLFDQPYIFSNDLYLHDRLREDYDDRRLGDRITIGKRFDYNFQVSISARVEEVKIYHIIDPRFRSEQILNAEGDHPLTGLGATVHYDTLNPGFLPYKGFAVNGSYEYVGALGGEYNFHKFTLNLDAYQTLRQDLLDRRTILNLHAFTGYIPGEAPFFEKFYGGGIGSIRGFRFRGVSPRDGRGEDPVGGDFAITGTAEVNFPIYEESLRGVIFADAGDVESGVHIGTIRTSVGAGIRLILPFLGQTPLAIDFGVPLSKAHNDESQLISFSLGFAQ
jgi:outer membrane protein insertion porin family